MIKMGFGARILTPGIASVSGKRFDLDQVNVQRFMESFYGTAPCRVTQSITVLSIHLLGHTLQS